MLQVIKYRYLSMLTERLFLGLMFAFYATLNYMVLVQSGLLQPHPLGLNEQLRYALLMNNINHTTQAWGIFLPLYLGCRLIADDITTGQIYVMLTGNPNRARYLVGNWLGLVAVVITILALVAVNMMLISLALEIQVIASDVWHVMSTLLRNMLVIMTATAAVSAAVSTEAGLGVGLVQIVFFNLAAFQRLPFVQQMMAIDFNTRSWLATLSPIERVSAPSIEMYSRAITVPPNLFASFSQAALVHILLFLIIGVAVFRRRNL